MSVKITQEYFLNRFKKIYPDSNIKIKVWNGYTKNIIFYCDKCKQEHFYKDARELLSIIDYCQKIKSSNQSFSFSAFSARLNRLYDKEIEIVKYNSLSQPVEYICPECKKLKRCTPAKMIFSKRYYCEECQNIKRDIVKQKIIELFNNSTKYKMLEWNGVSNKIKIQCLNCNKTYERRPTNVLQCFDTCPYCNAGADKNRKSIEDAQKQLEEHFGNNTYSIIKYVGQLEKDNIIKCNNCGETFKAHFVSFLNSRGCPFCKRTKSKGEQAVQKYLENNHIAYEAQKRFVDCNKGLSSFDFCVYDEKGKMFLIEVNGVQHYKETSKFESLDIIQRRDNIKQHYCEIKKIPLIIIPYDKLTDKDIDTFLNFLKSSTTISTGE